MRRPDGRFEAIEVNLGNVALWWTSGFSSFRRKYALAVHRMLVTKHGASRTPLGFLGRMRNGVSVAVRGPKLLVREIQASSYRRRRSAELEAQHAPGLKPASSE